jgi:hypothetical protein
MRVPRESIHFYVKVPKTAENVFWSSDLLRKGHTFGQALYCIRVHKNFSLRIWGLWVSKDAEFNVDFTNINLPY